MTTQETCTETIGDRIRRRRDELNMTQDDVAGKIGVSRAAVAQWELNQTAPIRRRMTALGEALECSANWLSYGDSGAPLAEQMLMCSESETVAAQAYQVIGALAGDTGVYYDPEVKRALDYFGAIARGKQKPLNDFLPWVCGPPEE